MASRGVNKVILLGNITKDIDIRYMSNGNAVANFSIATNESWKDQQGQVQERTEFHNIVMYKRLAEIAGEYLKKGSKVYLEGKLQTSKWQDQTTGQDRYKTEINAMEMQMLDSKPSSGNAAQPQRQQQAPAQRPAQAPQRQAPQQQNNTAQNMYGNQNSNNQGGHHQNGAPAQRTASQTQQNFTPDLDKGWDDDIPFNQG